MLLSTTIQRFPAAKRAVVGSVRGLSFLHDQMRQREKVEEDRFMRQSEEAYLKKTKAAQQTAAQLKEFDDLIRPTMVDLHTHIKGKTHLSAKELEALARWKLGLTV